MAELPNKFAEFLSDIRPTEEQINDYIQGHETLRERLTSDDELSKIHVGDFLQGSYARSTAVRPVGDEKSDVDVAFVTNLLKDDYIVELFAVIPHFQLIDFDCFVIDFRTILKTFIAMPYVWKWSDQ